ncbi:MAG: dihydrolipoyl dehydrogenase [Actinobacteria bacterium]|jgi:dihydrolipoamide dehydrogenase|nr:dihydrolipoyl dehydrogenase [Actinomycetota bacterium]
MMAGRQDTIRQIDGQGQDIQGQGNERDVIIIGGGPAGYAAALYGASCGLRITVVEQAKVGGTCLHKGCVPAKELLEAASVWRSVKNAGEFGVVVDGTPRMDMAAMQLRKTAVVDQLHKGLSGLMKGRHVNVERGTGTLLPGKRVRVAEDGGGERVIAADHVVLATGSVTRSIPGLDIDGKMVVTSDEVLSLDYLPRTVAVIGGGAIGCEFASYFSDLGADVTVLEALPRLLAGCDEDISNALTRSFKRRGIKVHTGVQVRGHEPSSSTTTVSFGDGESVVVEMVVVAVGRRPFTDGVLGEGVDVKLDGRGFVVVNGELQTGETGVWAVGDIVDTPQLAHVGFLEGIQVIKHILGEPALPIDYGKVPWGIYSHPEVAFAGMSEEQARAAGYEVMVRKDPFGGNSRAKVLGETDGMVKVVAEVAAGGSSGRILGVHIIGPWATELLSPGYLAVNWEATPDDFAGLIQPHPTLSEAFGEVMISLTGRGLHIG